MKDVIMVLVPTSTTRVPSSFHSDVYPNVFVPFVPTPTTEERSVRLLRSMSSVRVMDDGLGRGP